MTTRAFELRGLDGANPLGFLAALGALASLSEARLGEPKLRWMEAPRWTPVLEGVAAHDPSDLSRAVSDALRGASIDPKAETRRAEAQHEMENAKTAIKKKLGEIKKRGLRGAARSEAVERELLPLQREYEEKRRLWLEALREAVPSPELALGKRIDCTSEEFRTLAATLAAESTSASRGSLDLLAAFGSDACLQARSEAIQPTPFCFVTGSGHQFFLDTARQLMARVAEDRVQSVLFAPWDYRDEGLSLRWDPIEDRRYALMDRDPTASDNRPRTVWMANLLAYRALALFPSAPVGSRLVTAGWDYEGRTFTWPLWQYPVGLDGVRSLVQLRLLVEERPDPTVLRSRGIAAVFRAERIEVGEGANRKLNFSPSRRVC
ncbi:MAG: hypothetical protein KatS3mg076_0074 [Candidatus Binatia bacterium]|nr:MAG: hypothetical protein KatS3mg076_0074 [Candidatus Binatia bacterium]